MKRYALLILIALAGCSPQYKSGKTECSTSKQCPGGYSCSDDGTTATHYCVDNTTLGCLPAAGFYCSQSKTCWAQPGACSTVTQCGTTKHPGSVICASANYHPDCNGDSCLPNSGSPDSGAGGAIGTGGATVKGSGGSTVIGVGGAAGTGGIRDAGPDGGGFRDAGVGGAFGTGGVRDAGVGGAFGTGGIRDAGVIGAGGVTGRGGAIGTGGISSGGGSTGSMLCSGTAPFLCSASSSASQCATDPGCSWNATAATCSGTASACSVYSSSTACILNGCTWAGTLVCTTTPITATCSSAAASTTDACTLCIYNSCCGPLMNCVNDTNCSSSSTGPSWNAYMDCTVNCCSVACNL